MKLIYRFLILVAVFATIVDARGRMSWTDSTDTTSVRSEGNPFTCSVDSFVFVSESKDYPTDGYGLNLYDDSINNNTVAGIENFYGDNINAIGYNVKDNYIWGYDREGKKVVRIDDNYHVDSYSIAGLPSYSSYTTGGYHIGDVSVDGILHLATRDDPSKIYRVDLNLATPAMLPVLILSGATFNTADFAFHPTNGNIYLPDNNSDNLYEIDLTTNEVTSVSSLGVTTFTGSNVVFFDKDNNFYFNNGDDDNIYKIDLTDPSNPSSTSIYVEFEIPSQGDGARCMNAQMQETKDKKISGKIFEDIDGDGLANASSNIDNATVYLYKDTDNNSSKESASSLHGTTTTNSSGEYEFDVSNGTYFVVVDSKTITKGGSSFPDIWAEQTYGSKGGLCNDGGWGEVKLGSAGACYGGWRGNYDDDDASSLANAEHVAIVDINNSDSSDVDFGFSFNVVISGEEHGQGSLRQFIENANTISGENKMRFVPAVVTSESFWSIKLTSALPVITDDGTTIDGMAYNPNGSIRDENSGVLGSGIKLGTGSDGVIDSADEPTLGDFNKPELEINIDRQAEYGIKAEEDDGTMITDISVKNIAIYGSNATSWDVDGASDIIIYGSAKDIDISGNFVGVRADGSALSPLNKTNADGIMLYATIGTISDFKINNNYVLDIGNHAIYTVGKGGFVQNGEIYQNEVARAAWAGEYQPDCVTVEVDSKDIEIYQNYVYECSGGGFDTWESAGGIKWYDNTAYNNGYGAGRSEIFGLRSKGDNNEIYNNHIYGNKGPGILVAAFNQQAKPTHKTKISKNSIYGNSISIDLDQTHGYKGTGAYVYDTHGDGPTPNDGLKDNLLQNESMDYPVFTKVVIGSTNLSLKGYVGSAPNQSIFSNATIEVFKADENGGAKWYLGTFTSDTNGNFDLNMTIPTNVTLEYGDKIVATARDANNNTSELGVTNFVEDAVPLGCLQNAIILNDTKNIYELDTINGNKSEFTDKLQQINNAIGYNHKDGYVWGYNNDDLNGTFVRIGKDLNGEYITKTFGPVAGIPTGADQYFNVGDVDKNGHLYMLLNADKKSVYVVDLDSSSSTFLELIKEYNISNGGSQVDIQDWAFHPENGKLYAARYGGSLYEIDPSKTGSDAVNEKWEFIKGLENNSSISYEGFFDDNGYFYTYGAQAGKVYRIDLTDPDNPKPNAVLFAPKFAGGNGGDSTRCNKATMGDVPIIEIKDAKILEGHSGSKILKFSIFSDRNITDVGGLRVDYTVSGDVNVSVGDDYAPALGDVVILMGEQNATIEIKILGDTKVEKDEKLFIDITENVTKYHAFDPQAEGIIINDDYDIELRAIDTTNSFDWEDGRISTKIVNKQFGLTILAYNHTLNKPQSDMNITKIELESDVLWSGSLLTDADGKVDLGADSLTISRAFKDASLRIYGDFNQTHDYNSTSSDRFSVRPDTFKIEIPVSSKAGESFNFTILALGEGGNQAMDYNETNSSFILKYKQNNESNCSEEGNFTIPNLHFQDGEATYYSAKYSEVGRLDFNISEIIGSEYALVDVLDTNEADRIISMGENSMAFIPDRFDVNWTMSGESNYADVLFFADADSVGDMGAGIVANVKAVSADGNVTKNYTNGCISHDTRLTIDFDVYPQAAEKLVWQDMNNNTNSDSVDVAPNFTFDINASAYDSGKANASLKVNFSREENKPKNPIRFTVSKVEASADSSSIIGESSHNERLDIYYGRLHVPSVSTTGEDMEVTAIHEVYCDGCDESMFTQASGKESPDSINWYVISDNPDAIVGNATSRENIVNSTIINVMSLTAPKLPYVDRIWYTPKSYLVYNRYSNSATRHSYRAEFMPKESVWSGKGSEGKTIKRDSSKRIIQKMDW